MDSVPTEGEIFMPVFQKDVLYAGRWLVGRNPDGSPRYAEYSPDDIREFAVKGNQFVQKGINIPVCYEHRSDANASEELSQDDIKSGKATGIIGWIEGFSVAGDSVKARVNIPSLSDAEQFENVRFVSPKIAEFMDGRGTEWGRAITHVALTGRPVQFPQEPPVAVCLSLEDFQPVSLSHEVSRMKDESKAPAEEKDEKDDEKKSHLSEMSKDEKFGEVLKLLKWKGIALPDDTKPNNVWDRLHIALTAIKSTQEMELMGNNLASVKEGQSQPVLMSQNSVENPALAKQIEQAKNLARTNLGSRIDKLVATGRITPVIAQKLKAELTSVELSFENSGDLAPNAVAAKVEAYEMLPESNAWQAEHFSQHAVEIKMPEFVKGPTSDDDFLKRWSEMVN